MKILRILIIGLVFVVITWIGAEIGPQHMTAEAKIFEKFMSLSEKMPAYLFDENATSEPVKVLVNGNTTWLSVTKTEDDIAEVLRFYYNQYMDQPTIGVPSEIMDRIGDVDYTKQLTNLDVFNKRVGEYQHFLLVREHYGFLGVIDFHDKKSQIGSEEFLDSIKKVEKTGRFGDIAIGRAVIALKGKQAKKATVVNVWTDDDFSLNNLKKDISGNMPGFDIEDVPIYHTNRREFSLEQDNPLSLYRMVQYKGEGSLPAHIIFLHSRMESNGWIPDGAFEEVTRSNNSENIMFYTKENRECTIQVERDKAFGKINTTVIENTIKSG